VQTEDQVAMAERNIGRKPRLIRSFCERVDSADGPGEREAFLWIGGLIDYKDPMAYVRLAEQVPEARFWMIGTGRGADWDALSAEVEASAERLPNLELLPPRSREALRELYARAVAVVNTSEFEGFPNTFMEGWACGAPALSLRIDPDRVIGRRDLGYVADGSSEALAEAARRLWASRTNAHSRATAAREYIAATHDPDIVAAQWAQMIEGLTR
jgi:glycosyltransferase involved in cell wall biosynthesis